MARNPRFAIIGPPDLKPALSVSYDAADPWTLFCDQISEFHLGYRSSTLPH